MAGKILTESKLQKEKKQKREIYSENDVVPKLANDIQRKIVEELERRKTIKRNDRCYCGSKEKYKKCCWAKDHLVVLDGQYQRGAK